MRQPSVDRRRRRACSEPRWSTRLANALASSSRCRRSRGVADRRARSCAGPRESAFASGGDLAAAAARRRTGSSAQRARARLRARESVSRSLDQALHALGLLRHERAVTRFRSTLGRGRGPAASRRKPPSTVSGVRSSCETLATKSRRIARDRFELRDVAAMSSCSSIAERHDLHRERRPGSRSESKTTALVEIAGLEVANEVRLADEVGAAAAPRRVSRSRPRCVCARALPTRSGRWRRAAHAVGKRLDRAAEALDRRARGRAGAGRARARADRARKRDTARRRPSSGTGASSASSAHCVRRVAAATGAKPSEHADAERRAPRSPTPPRTRDPRAPATARSASGTPMPATTTAAQSDRFAVSRLPAVSADARADSRRRARSRSGPSCAERLERLAQAPDVDVDGALLDEDVVAPDLIEQLRPRCARARGASSGSAAAGTRWGRA